MVIINDLNQHLSKIWKNDDTSGKNERVSVLSPTENIADKIYESFIKTTSTIRAWMLNGAASIIVTLQMKSFPRLKSKKKGVK